MKKQIDLSELQPDPITSALAEAGKDAIIVTGFIRSVSDAAVFLTEQRDSRTFVQYPREGIITAFEEEDESGRISLIVNGEIDVQVIRETRASTTVIDRCKCSNEINDQGVFFRAPTRPGPGDTSGAVNKCKAGCDDEVAPCIINNYRRGMSIDDAIAHCELMADLCDAFCELKSLGGSGSVIV